MRIAHVVVTPHFAGTERYVVDVSTRSAALGHDVVVFGGSPTLMPTYLEPSVEWQPAATPTVAVRALSGGRRFDIVHAHLTDSEAAAVVTKSRHRGAVISTRHIAARRGNSVGGRVLAPVITAGLAAEIAISHFVAAATELPPTAVLHNGVPSLEPLWDPAARTVVMAHRLEAEKDTFTGLRGWARSHLHQAGWRLLLAGNGGQREQLERFVAAESITGVEFVGHVEDMATLWSRTGLLLAPAPAEPLGLAVLEAMAAGAPVVAALAGGHLETIGAVEGQVGFAPGDADGVAHALRTLANDEGLRASIGAASRVLQQRGFDLDNHVDDLLIRYAITVA